MDEIDQELTRRIAELARLELGDREVRGLADDLRTILRHFADLPSRERESDGATVHGGPSLSLRADVPSADPLARAPGELARDAREGFFVVPRLSAMQEEAEDG